MPLMPAEYQNDLNTAVRILKDAGCSEGYLFGSLAKGAGHAKSDIDLAVRGIAPSAYFKVYGELALHLDRAVDLVDLDDRTAFSRRLSERGDWLRVI